MEYILSLVIAFPFVCALCAIVLKENLKAFGIIASSVELGLCLLLWWLFDPSLIGFQFIHERKLIPSFGVSYLVGLDGISLFLVILSAFISLIGFIYLNEKNNLKNLVISLLFLEGICIGVFSALDAILFYIFWELSLVPMLYIIGAWGSGEKIYAAVKFFIYTFFGSLLMLLGIIFTAYFNFTTSGVWSFNLLFWLENGSIPLGLQAWLFLAFFAGFAIKVPLFPFHTWLPYAHGQAPTIGSIILAAILLKMGTYGFLRFSLPLFPDASLNAVLPIAILSLIMIIYGAAVALAQKDAKQVVAYSSISHMGIIMLGIFALNAQGIAGASVFMLSHGVISGALFMLVGFIYERRHTKELAQFGGIAKVMPKYGAIFGFMIMASAGLPLTMGFVGEFLSLLGFFATHPILAAIGGVSIILGAVYMLVLFARIFYGRLNNPLNLGLLDLNARELCAIVPLVLVVAWLGIYPKPILNPINNGSLGVLSLMQNRAVSDKTREFLNVPKDAPRPRTEPLLRDLGNLQDQNLLNEFPPILPEEFLPADSMPFAPQDSMPPQDSIESNPQNLLEDSKQDSMPPQDSIESENKDSIESKNKDSIESTNTNAQKEVQNV